MLEDRRKNLKGCRVLILEDEYLIADDLESALTAQGAEVIGPIAELCEANKHVAQDEFDAVVMDIDLRGQSAYSIADDLVQQHIPFVFATGYGADTIPKRFQYVARWEKPYDVAQVVDDLARLCRERREDTVPTHKNDEAA